jgi:antitoxin (DNA-binding transcriptional repressor) of toxin-antitoxin stability system
VRRTITQRELRNQSVDVTRALGRGERFVVTRNGAAVGELTPATPSPFVSREDVPRVFAGAPAIDAEAFRADVDAGLDQDPAPRA